MEEQVTTQKGYIKITPFDGLFFGKGRPFDQGEDSWTEADLLPPPQVVWGALFSQLWYQDSSTSLDSLKIGRIMLIGSDNTTQLYLPAPLDLFQVDTKKERYNHQFYWEEDEGFVPWSGKNALLKPNSDEEVELLKNEWIAVSSLSKYLGADTVFNVHTIQSDAFIKSEYKIGISRSDTSTKSVTDGMLYTVNLACFNENYELIIEAEFPETMPNRGIIKLGGEGKLANFECFYDRSKKEGLAYRMDNALKYDMGSDKVSFFKVYLTSPAVLDKDGYPKFLKNDNFSVEAGVVGKPIGIGGFDFQYNRPKELSKYAPAGSVFIVEATTDKAISAQDAKDLLSELLPTDTHKGFNQFEIYPYYGN